MLLLQVLEDLLRSLGEGTLEASRGHKHFYKGYYALPEASRGFRGSFWSLLEATDLFQKGFYALLEASGGLWRPPEVLLDSRGFLTFQTISRL